MSSPCLSLAISPLKASGDSHFAIWVTHAPFPSGAAHNDSCWTETLTQTWQAWQELFSSRGLPNVPYISAVHPAPTVDMTQPGDATPLPLGSRLMQQLGIHLWQWLFDGAVQASFSQSRGFANGQHKPLRLRLDIRDPNLVYLPWEIMQEQAGKQAISLSQQVLFSRTTSDVDPLPLLQTDQSLRILLVLGQDSEPRADLTIGTPSSHPNQNRLRLEQEASALAQLLGQSTNSNQGGVDVPCQVTPLLQPTPAELIQYLENKHYNVFFYAGHGMPGADGGYLFLQPGTRLNGTELAQVLTRCHVKLAVFNACWGAQPDQEKSQPIPRSSLAEVLIHHGVPAVLGMRDSITDQEALSFIEAFVRSIVERKPIDQAVAVARQHLLTLYRFNEPAWTLPVLYMHPDFDGELIEPRREDVTILPSEPPAAGEDHPIAFLQSRTGSTKLFIRQNGVIRVGRLEDNDLVIRNLEVSRRHAEIFCRDVLRDGQAIPTYFLRDDSKSGTLLLEPGRSTDLNSWQKIHKREVPLTSGNQLKFGGFRSEIYEFVIQRSDPSDQSGDNSLG